MICWCDLKNSHAKIPSIAQDTPNYNESCFNCTQAHFLLLKIVIIAIFLSVFEIFKFCLHHVKDKVNIDLEQVLTQISTVHWKLPFLPYSATFGLVVFCFFLSRLTGWVLRQIPARAAAEINNLRVSTQTKPIPKILSESLDATKT